jgi:hypothetical protein
LSTQKDDLRGWQDSWPPLSGFWDPLIPHIASLQHISATMEHQVIICFKNRYGVKISQNFLHESLYEVTVLRFLGRNLENYCLVKHSRFYETTWYLNSSEVLSICEQVAHWPSKTGNP